MQPTEQFLHALIEANPHVSWTDEQLHEFRESINQRHTLKIKDIPIAMLPAEIGLLQNLRRLAVENTQTTTLPYERC